MNRIIFLVVIIFLVACGSDSVISSPSDVKGDVTGSWKKATTSEDMDITEHALDYANKHMESGETHFIINFTSNTTSVIREQNGLVFVDVHERVDKEEHDAKTIGSGMLLSEYIIYSDGKVEKLK